MSSIRPLAGLVVVEIGYSIRNSIPSVVLNDGTLSPVVISPIASPIRAHAPNLFGRRCERTKTGADFRPTAI